MDSTAAPDKENRRKPGPELLRRVLGGQVELPTELPKTATLYPLFSLGGLISLAAYGLLRIKNLA